MHFAQREGWGPAHLQSSRRGQGRALQDGGAHGVTDGLVFLSVHQEPVHLARMVLLQPQEHG